MSNIWIPPHVEDAIAADRVRAIVDGREAFDQALRSYSERLSLRLAEPHIDQTYGFVPGAFHVRRENEDGSFSYYAIVDEDGNPTEPTQAVIETLRQNDLRNGGMERIAQAEETARKARAAQKQRDREDRQDHMRDLLTDRISISVPR
jgi:hypothetical protein